MHRFAKAITLGLPLAIVVAGAVVPMPVRWSIGAIVIGFMLFQLSLMGVFRRLFPEPRVYLALRSETDKLLKLIRELNGIAIAAKQRGEDPAAYTAPVMAKLYSTVDRLPMLAAESADGELHMTPAAERELRRPDEIH